MLGYARYQNDHWEYSGQAVDVLAQYITRFVLWRLSPYRCLTFAFSDRFPALFVYLQSNARADQYKEEDLLAK